MCRPPALLLAGDGEAAADPEPMSMTRSPRGAGLAPTCAPSSSESVPLSLSDPAQMQTVSHPAAQLQRVQRERHGGCRGRQQQQGRGAREAASMTQASEPALRRAEKSPGGRRQEAAGRKQQAAGSRQQRRADRSAAPGL